MNVLKSDFNTRYEATPFSKIKNTDFVPAINYEIAKSKKLIDKISLNKTNPNFENTIKKFPPVVDLDASIPR